MPSNRKSVCQKYYQKNKSKIQVYRKSIAKEQRRKHYIKSKYGIEVEEFDNWFEIQKGKCWICESKFDDNNKPQIDHNHTTDIVRGLLCWNCNVGLGHFKENINSLKSAIIYLGAK